MPEHSFRYHLSTHIFRIVGIAGVRSLWLSPQDLPLLRPAIISQRQLVHDISYEILGVSQATQVPTSHPAAMIE